jgi:hypothetical protein
MLIDKKAGGIDTSDGALRPKTDHRTINHKTVPAKTASHLKKTLEHQATHLTAQ